MKRAFFQQKNCEIIVALVPARTSVKWFHRFCMRAKEIHFFEGRLKFVDRGSPGASNSAPFPSMIVVLDGEIYKKPEFYTIPKKANQRSLFEV